MRQWQSEVRWKLHTEHSHTHNTSFLTITNAVYVNAVYENDDKTKHRERHNSRKSAPQKKSLHSLPIEKKKENKNRTKQKVQRVTGQNLSRTTAEAPHAKDRKKNISEGAIGGVWWIFCGGSAAERKRAKRRLWPQRNARNNSDERGVGSMWRTSLRRAICGYASTKPFARTPSPTK